MFWNLLLLALDLYIYINIKSCIPSVIVCLFKVLCKTSYLPISCYYYSVLISDNISSLLDFWRRWPRWDGLFEKQLTLPLGISYLGISRQMYWSLFPPGLLNCITPKGTTHTVLWNCALKKHSHRTQWKCCSLRWCRKYSGSKFIYSYHNSYMSTCI